MTLVETIAALLIVSVALLGLLDELVTYVHQQMAQRAHATAMRIATTALEDARRLPAQTLGSSSFPTTTQSRNGVAYTTSTTVQTCATSNQASCVSPSSGDSSVARVGITVSWTDTHGAHHVSLSTADADTSAANLPGSSSGLTGGSSGASGTSVSVTSLSLTPNSASIDAGGHPLSDVTVSLVAVGLASSTSVPFTWTDDNGAHQGTLVNSGTTTWSATVAKASITRAVASGHSTVVFAATVPGVHNIPTTSLDVVALPRFSGNCTVTASPIVIIPLTRRTTLPEIVSCSTEGLASSDQVKAVYASGAGTATLNLTSANGSTWTGTIPAATSMAGSGSSESFTFALTRVADSYTTSQSKTVSLA